MRAEHLQRFSRGGSAEMIVLVQSRCTRKVQRWCRCGAKVVVQQGWKMVQIQSICRAGVKVHNRCRVQGADAIKRWH